MDLIKKRADEIISKKQTVKIQKSYKDYVYDFFEKMEELYKLKTDNFNFFNISDAAIKTLHSNLKYIDAGIHLELKWNDGENYKTLRLNGIRIKWSDSYMQKNPGILAEEYIDQTHMVFDFMMRG